MQYRIRVWVAPDTGQKLYYPQYNRYTKWHQTPRWEEGRAYETVWKAKEIINNWKEKGVPEESYYIKQ